MKANQLVIILALLLSPLLSEDCNRGLMKSYFLQGLVKVDNFKSPLCSLPDFSNCCTKQDILYIFEDYTGNVAPKLNMFFKKMYQSIEAVRRLNNKLLKVQLPSTLSNEKQLTCSNANIDLQNFPFDQMISNLKDNLESNFLFFNRVHQSFYCLLCDKNAHAYIDISNNQVTMDIQFCLNVLSKS